MKNNLETDIIKYLLLIAKSAVDKFNIDASAATSAIVESGIRKIIEEDPAIAMRYDPEEWLENIEAYLRPNKSVI